MNEKLVIRIDDEKLKEKIKELRTANINLTELVRKLIAEYEKEDL